MAFRLPRLQRTTQIIESDGKPHRLFQQWWQSVVSKIEDQETGQDQILSDLQQAQSDIGQLQSDPRGSSVIVQSDDALFPPSMPFVFEDLMYPPRYGV